MISKLVASAAAALADVPDGATVMIGGFGTAGIPDELIAGLLAQGARDLTLVNNNAGNAEQGLAALLKAGRVRKIICSFPRQTDSYVFDGLYRSGQLELELVEGGGDLIGFAAVLVDGGDALFEVDAGFDGAEHFIAGTEYAFEKLKLFR